MRCQVRLQTDGMAKGPDGNLLPKKYAGMMDAGTSIVKEQGILGLWTGVGPTAGRATVRLLLIFNRIVRFGAHVHECTIRIPIYASLPI